MSKGIKGCPGERLNAFGPLAANGGREAPTRHQRLKNHDAYRQSRTALCNSRGVANQVLFRIDLTALLFQPHFHLDFCAEVLADKDTGIAREGAGDA